MNLGLEDKYVLITGACQGIGLATAEVFLQEGANICITGRNFEKLENVGDRLSSMYPDRKIICFLGDATKDEDIERLHAFIEKQWKKIDIIIPNIGSGKPMNRDSLAIEEWKRLFEVNLFGGVKVLKRFRDMLVHSHGNIVMISSIVSKQTWGSSYAYAASKSSVLSLVKYMARDMARDNVRVNCVLPGNVFFEGGRWEEIIADKTKEEVAEVYSAVPMQRFGKPEEIAAGIVFLASEKASFITGSALVIDGGQTSVIG